MAFRNALKYIAITFLVFVLFSCDSSEEPTDVIPLVKEENPAALDFNTENSDKKAIEIADKVMLSMGGRKAWDDTKIIKWNFFDARTLLWNKHTGDVRIEFPDNDSTIFMVNIFSHKGKIKMNGEELTQSDSIKKYTEMAESIWINDAYWLFMPFKLKDSKTTLKYLAVDTTVGGIYSDKLELTFNEIGDTPDNKYWIYVDTTTHLVNQWAYFNSNTDTLPIFSTPWEAYNKYGDLLLSGYRGKRNITEIEVLDSVDVNVFLEF